MKVLADASLPNINKLFSSPFEMTLFDNQNQIKSMISKFDVLFCRSTLAVTADLLRNTSIKVVATASSGTDHIDKKFLEANNILLIDAKGSNATAVVDYVIATISYLKKTNKLTGRFVGVIGNGQVGSRLYVTLQTLGFKVKSYDPILAINHPSYRSCSLDDIVNSDLICVHANLHTNNPFPSKNLLNSDFLAKLKPGVSIINAARGGIVDENALISTFRDVIYCTDVYCNEPNINHKIVELAEICTPHIAGHSVEAKNAAVLQVAKHIYDYAGVNTIETQVESPDDLPLNTSYSGDPNWQDDILKIYNPINETNILKESTNKQQTFVELRKAHNFRHDFRIST
ncbi:MAG: NAD(P)-dependent oxidoreductase [Legionellaceae bacterium]|nr:NAD(P)-dependent oxidoreductase [Legionellaceae bacterium]